MLLHSDGLEYVASYDDLSFHTTPQFHAALAAFRCRGRAAAVRYRARVGLLPSNILKSSAKLNRLWAPHVNKVIDDGLWYEPDHAIFALMLV